MTESESNPHLDDQTPGSWDPPIRRSVLGIGLPLLILAFAFQAFITTTATIPLPRRGRPGFHWMQVDGLFAITWGLLLIGISTALHGSYFWRYRTKNWKYYQSIQTAGLIVAVPASLITTAHIVYRLLQ